MEKNILFLSTFPINRPRYGGQIRLYQIVQQYKIKDWNCRSIAIYEQESFAGEDLGPYDIPFPVDSKYRCYKGKDIPQINDFLTGFYACAEEGGFNHVKRFLPEKIDVIHIEHCWLWPLALKIKSLPEFTHIKLIYGSANIEAPLKKIILDQFRLTDSESVLHLLADISALEKQAALTADLVAAVTKMDCAEMVSWGATQVCLAENGIEPWRASEDKLKQWTKKLPVSRWFLYVASAHLPNFISFNQIIGESLGCFPPDSKLVIAGSVCEQLYQQAKNSKWPNLNLSRLQLLSELADDDLAAVKSLAHGYFLPIEHGGGSNLKTAEALYSKKYVVATPQAFRGFEEYIDLERVNIFTTPQMFHQAIRTIIDYAAPVISDEEQNKLQALTWSETLAELIHQVESLPGRNVHG